MYFEQIFDRPLAQYAYLIGCQATGEAIVFDPMRDIDRYLKIAQREGLNIVAVAETHIHADFLSGARELAEHTGAKVYVSGEGGDDWQVEWAKAYPHTILRDGDDFAIGNLRFDVHHTPGHTPEHIVFVVTDHRSTKPMGMVSGDFVFVGDVGRPDLLETAAGQVGEQEPSARAMYRSLARFREFPADLQVWPGHGAGSACGKALGAVPLSTVGYELANNASIAAATSEDAFVDYILDGQPEPPYYFGRMKRVNRSGPPVLGDLPKAKPIRPAKLSELSDHLGVAVLDTRPWNEFRRAHLPGALHTPLGRTFNTVAGCYVTEDKPIYLIIDESAVEAATRDLVHVGLDHIVGFATPDVFAEYVNGGGDAQSVREVGVEDLDDPGEHVILDVRRAAERDSDGKVAGTLNVAHTRLIEHLDDLPKDKGILVHCRSGVRSGYACGFLQRHGFDVTNVAGGFLAWQQRQRSGGV